MPGPDGEGRGNGELFNGYKVSVLRVMVAQKYKRLMPQNCTLSKNGYDGKFCDMYVSTILIKTKTPHLLRVSTWPC